MNWRLDRNLTQLSPAVGTELSWCSCRSWAHTGGEAALWRLIWGPEGQVKIKVSNHMLGSIKRSQLSRGQKSNLSSLFSTSETAAETLCPVLGSWRQDRCGNKPHGSHWVIPVSVPKCGTIPLINTVQVSTVWLYLPGLPAPWNHWGLPSNNLVSGRVDAGDSVWGIHLWF